MRLAQEDIEFIKAHLGEWLVEAGLGKPVQVYEIELREDMNRRFEALDRRIDRCLLWSLGLSYVISTAAAVGVLWYLLRGPT